MFGRGLTRNWERFVTLCFQSGTWRLINTRYHNIFSATEKGWTRMCQGLKKNPRIMDSRNRKVKVLRPPWGAPAFMLSCSGATEYSMHSIGSTRRSGHWDDSCCSSEKWPARSTCRATRTFSPGLVALWRSCSSLTSWTIGFQAGTNCVLTNSAPNCNEDFITSQVYWQ